MDHETATIAPSPPFVRWFSPWRWFAHWRPRKRRLVFFSLALVIYVLLPVPVVIIGKSTGLARYAAFDAVQNVFFAPIFWCVQNSESVAWFYFTQLKIAMDLGLA